MNHGFRSLRLGSMLIACVGVSILAFERGGAESTAPASSVDVKPIKYSGLVDAVKAQRGKVVVVDVWADWCVNCKKAFPHLVELHQKHARQGLVCMSVSLDDKPEQKASSRQFLQKMNASFPNYLLDEPEGFWQSRWNVSSIPLVFVFDRQGRRAGKFSEEERAFTHQDIENLVLQLLPVK